MSDECGVANPETGEIAMPPPMNLSAERLHPYGLYLIDDGQTQFLWIGAQAVPQLIEDVFGLPSIEHIKVGKGTLPTVEGSDFNERIRNVIEKSRDHKLKKVGSITVPHLYFVRQDGEPSLRLWALTMLVEDRADMGVSLQQFLASLRDKVGTA